MYELLVHLFPLSALFPFHFEVFHHCYYSSFRSTALFTNEQGTSLLSGPINCWGYERVFRQDKEDLYSVYGMRNQLSGTVGKVRKKMSR